MQLAGTVYVGATGEPGVDRDIPRRGAVGERTGLARTRAAEADRRRREVQATTVELIVSHVDVRLTVRGVTLHLSIQDDGTGGADLAKGSGLIGLMDRVEAVGGHIEITSPRTRHLAARPHPA